MKINKQILLNNFYFLKIATHKFPGLIIFQLIIVIISSFRTVFMSMYLLQYIVNSIENKSKLTNVLIFLSISLLIISATFILEGIFTNYIRNIYNQKISQELQLKIFDKLKHLDTASFDNTDTYSNIILSAPECEDRMMSVIDNVFEIISSVLTIGIIIGYSLTLDIIIFFIAIVSFIIAYFINIKIAKLQVEFNNEMIKKTKTDSFVNRIFSLPEYNFDVKLTNIKKVLLKLYNENKDEKITLINNKCKKIWLLSFTNSVFNEALILDFILPLILVIRILIFKNLAISSFMALINGAYQLKYKLDAVTNAISVFYQNGLYINRYQDLMKTPALIECENKESISKNLFKQLQCENISFAFPDNKFSLKNINFTINKKDRIAIVGPNGSGKTTLIKILLRFYDVSNGQITINNENVKNINVECYRKYFSVLLQDYNMYATNLKYNISMDDICDNKKLQKSIDKVNIKKYFSNYNELLDMDMTQEFNKDGLIFSGGQEQRFALCRAYYQESDILIFDEPTSAQDAKYEEYFYNMIEEQSTSEAIIFVSHRLSSVKQCNKILYMENGEIIETGTHIELMALKEKYYNLYNTQADMYNI